MPKPPLPDTIRHSRRCLAFATEVQLLAMDKAPDPWVESVLQKAVHRIRHRYGTSRDLKKTQIVAYMRTDAAGESVSVPELADYFGWKVDLLRELIGELLSEARPRIEQETRQTVNPGPRGGRPATRYRLTGT